MAKPIDSQDLKVFGSDLEAFSRSFTTAIQSSPPEQRNQLERIRSEYFHEFGFDGTYARLSNRTVREILAESRPVSNRVIAEGELNGVRFRLTEPNPPSEE